MMSNKAVALTSDILDRSFIVVNINYPGRGENQTLCCKCKQTLKVKRTQAQWSERFFLSTVHLMSVEL